MADDNEFDDDIVLDEDDEGDETTGKKKLIFIILGVLLLLGGGAGAYFFLMGGDPASEEGELETLAESTEDTLEAATNGIPVYYQVPEFLVDLNSSDRGKSSFLKMKVSIELQSQADVEILESYMPRVRDNFITYLRELRASDLSGSAGMFRLREELMLRINQAIAPAKVNNILFNEIVVQ